MELVAIKYEDGVPANLPDAADGEILLYGMDGEYAVGPVLGQWDTTSDCWSDQRYGEIEWVPQFFAVPPKNPCRSFKAPTVGNEVV